MIRIFHAKAAATMKSIVRHLLVAIALAGAGTAFAEPLTVASSGGFAAAYKRLVTQWEAQPDHAVRSEWGPSMGQTHNAIPARLARHEPIDVVIMVGDALDKLMAEGLLVPCATRRSISARTASALRLRDAPRTSGITQKLHENEQPSWIFTKARTRSTRASACTQPIAPTSPATNAAVSSGRCATTTTFSGKPGERGR